MVHNLLKMRVVRWLSRGREGGGSGESVSCYQHRIADGECCGVGETRGETLLSPVALPCAQPPTSTVIKHSKAGNLPS